MLPQELTSKYVIPEVKGLIAHKLASKGVSQFKISKLLGISQPMVSKYLLESPETYLRGLEEVGLNRDEVNTVADMLAELLINGRRLEFLRILTSYMNLILKRKTLCEKHFQLDPDIPRDCDICVKLFAVFEDPYVDDVKKAYELLALHPRGYELVPEVGMNIVSAHPNASTVNDIAGFTGRIVKVGKKVVAVGDPTLGGSKHTAEVLLTVMKKYRHYRAAVVVKYSEECVEKLTKLNHKVVKSGPHENPLKFFENLKAVVDSKEPEILADLGGVGLEPVIYVFAGSAIEAVKKAFKCL